MDVKMKNIEKSEILTLKEQISYQDGQVCTSRLIQK